MEEPTSRAKQITRDGTTVAIYNLPDGARTHTIQEIDDATSVVYAGVRTDTLIEVFRGTRHEVDQWVNTRTTRVLVFEGPADEALAWDEARREAGRNMLVPNLIIAAGLVILAVGMTLGWARKSRHPEPR